MKKVNLLVVIVAIPLVVGSAFGAQIANTSWDKSNLETLHAFGAEDVARFLNGDDVDQPSADRGEIGPAEGIVRVTDISGFTWANLSGDNQYQLVVVMQPLGSGGVNTMQIYSRDSFGKITEQELSGPGIHLEVGQSGPYIPKVIQDLDGDGKEELIIPAQLGFGAYGGAPVAIWPQVYRLQSGKLIDVSHDYAKFYDAQVLPELNREIDRVRERASLGNEKSRWRGG